MQVLQQFHAVGNAVISPLEIKRQIEYLIQCHLVSKTWNLNPHELESTSVRLSLHLKSLTVGEAGVMVQQVKLPLAILVSHIRVLVPVLTFLLPTLVPSDAPGKAATDDSTSSFSLVQLCFLHIVAIWRVTSG